MNAKAVLAISIIVVVTSVLGTLYALNFNQQPSTTTTITSTPINLKYEPEGPPRYFPSELFDVYVYDSDIWDYDEKGKPIHNHVQFELTQDNLELYEEIWLHNDPQSVVVIAPIFTITAYANGSFYDYYEGKCDETCIREVPIRYDLPPTFTSSANSIKVLTLLGYPFLTDIEIDKNPQILKRFDKVILLHNEYVTKNEFDAITSHPKVIYLHPNALYAEVETNYEKNTISLVRGHGYPNPNIKNGFDWKFDNSVLEYDTNCESWRFHEIENGVMLNCYPFHLIYQNSTLLKFLKDY